MVTYKQEVKEKSRQEIWTKAVNKLTTERNKQKILKPEYIKLLWNYSFNDILKDLYFPNNKIIDSWIDFSNCTYPPKTPEQLKIAYFCGPEPENDLQVLINLGIKIENVWAIESDAKMYSIAINNIKKIYPTLKIFNGDISDLVKAISFKFDIIYLDFTAPLFSKESKPLLKINLIFEHNALSDLGILITNSSLPESNAGNIEFLSSYFRSQTFIESPIITGDNSEVYYSEGADAHSLYTKEEIQDMLDNDIDWLDEDCDFEEKIKDNFDSAYSAFCSHYPVIIANYAQPTTRVSSIPSLRKMFFKKNLDKIKECIEKISVPSNNIFMDIDFEKLENNNYLDRFDFSGGELHEQHEDFPIWNFISRLTRSKHDVCKYWAQQFTKKNNGCLSLETIQLYDLLRNAQYSYKEILSENLSNSIKNIMKEIPDRKGGIFCDVPMPHLWMELALNHLGNAYHINTDQQWRAKYKAKKHEMYLDIFVFDSCRSLYDWLPMLDLYGEYLSSIERQIIVRSCIDAIKKQCHYSSFYSYFGAHLIGEKTKSWSKFGALDIRKNLND
ncbi:hypothetical protein [Providencia rettgeri]|uniref:hypothetical protein n=1 Tax=Providencia rettgeri TaxID=587 RepID=UPI002572CE9A|nr:hypothetical protein [Providencia rettgeri]MDL9988812.1 hypothetical protein [Providencia rettgeri]